MSKKLVILGAGGYANTVKDVSEQLGYDVIAGQMEPTGEEIALDLIVHTHFYLTSFACLGAIK